MADPFLSEIRMFSFGFAPRGWALCDGQLLPINQNQALFSLLGTTYGGNGQTNFALPDLRSRVPIHIGPGFALGQRAGEQVHTLSVAEMPTHAHSLQATTSTSTAGSPGAAVVLANSTGANLYASAANLVAMDPTSLADAGASQPHENRQPFLAITMCIALQGIFPSQN
ncbi:MAG: tail fiber protein [Ilumatobacteraceae bacterium]